MFPLCSDCRDPVLDAGYSVFSLGFLYHTFDLLVPLFERGMCSCSQDVLYGTFPCSLIRCTGGWNVCFGHDSLMTLPSNFLQQRLFPLSPRELKQYILLGNKQAWKEEMRIFLYAALSAFFSFKNFIK